MIVFNTLRPRENDRNFADDILKHISLNEICSSGSNGQNGSIGSDYGLATRGVARRRPRGPGLNLKMLKRITIHKLRSFYRKLHSHVGHCQFKSLLLASLRSPDKKFTCLCLHMYIWYLVYNWPNDHASLLFLMRVRFSEYQPSSY